MNWRSALLVAVTAPMILFGLFVLVWMVGFYIEYARVFG